MAFPEASRTALAHRLDDPVHGIPAVMGPWVQISKDEPLSPDMAQVLAAQQYVFRDYVDSRIILRDDVAATLSCFNLPVKNGQPRWRGVALPRTTVGFSTALKNQPVNIGGELSQELRLFRIPRRSFASRLRTTSAFGRHRGPRSRSLLCRRWLRAVGVPEVLDGTFGTYPDKTPAREISYRMIHLRDQTVAAAWSRNNGLYFPSQRKV